MSNMGSTSSPSMMCPRCAAPRELAERRFGNTRLHGCGSCGGVWLETKQARAVVAHLQGTLAIVVAAERVARAAQRKAGETRIVHCPLDGAPLTVVDADGVLVDVCDAHGTWFDAGEVRHIANAHTESPPSPKKHATQSRAGDGASDPIDVFTDFVSMLVDD